MKPPTGRRLSTDERHASPPAPGSAMERRPRARRPRQTATCLDSRPAGPQDAREACPPPTGRSCCGRPAFETTALLLGLVVGSFANVCIHRMPRRESVVSPPSRCPACGTLILARDNVPVFGWLLLRGRCRACRAPISWRYPAVEAANGILWLALAVLHGPAAADLRGDGAGHGPPRPGPDRPRPPDPARPDHAAGDRGGTRRELPAGLEGDAARRRRRGRGRLAGVRRRGQGVRARARDRGPGAGGLEDGGDARGVPRLAGDAAGRAARLGGGQRSWAWARSRCGAAT